MRGAVRAISPRATGGVPAKPGRGAAAVRRRAFARPLHPFGVPLPRYAEEDF